MKNENAIQPLPAQRLRRHCRLDGMDFETTTELDTLGGGDADSKSLGQPRAVEALEFGLGIEEEGFNLFAVGRSGSGKEALVRSLLERKAAAEAVPDDWCYVHNFEHKDRPRVLRLPPGRGRKLQRDSEKLVEELHTALATALESDEYHARRQEIEQELQDRQQALFEDLREESKRRGLTVVRTPGGVVFAPLQDGRPLSAEEMQELSSERREELEEAASELRTELQSKLRQMPRVQREAREKLRRLDREFAHLGSAGLVEEMQEEYQDLPQVVDHLERIQRDVVENLQEFLSGDEDDDRGNGPGLPGLVRGGKEGPKPSRRYRVNVLVDHGDDEGAPVVYEDNPTLKNLLGEVEHIAHMGALTTDFNLIKAGALHRANGGYLMLDARKVLTYPFVWEALKRALRSSRVRFESPAERFSFISTASLEPQAIPLDVKVTLLGEPRLYYLLSALDPELDQLFKVQADFADRMDRSADSERRYAHMLAGLIEEHELKPFQRDAVGRVLERSARLAGDSERLSTEGRTILDLLRQADYWAGRDEAEVVEARHVRKAIEAQIFRADRLRERTYEAIDRGDLLIDTSGTRVGQVNGLAVAQLGNFAFARPSRISAQVRLGKGEVVDIERESKLGGPLHSKGVLILAGYLGSRCRRDLPLSISASLVFEQSYGGVEGDSASSAELYALISAITEIPMRQSFAVTGSVNQYGEVQAIGAVNEKVEGFFDVCRRNGLDGEQGVLIPAANVKHLMLRDDVVEAAEAGRFRIFPIETIDEGIELLSGMPAGQADDGGEYPEDSVNGRLRAALEEMARKRLGLLGAGVRNPDFELQP